MMMDWTTLTGALGAVLAATGAAAHLAALLPRPAPGSALAALFWLLDWLAGNYLNARNVAKGAALLLLAGGLMACAAMPQNATLASAALACAVDEAGAITGAVVAGTPTAAALGQADLVLVTDAHCQAAVAAGLTAALPTAEPAN
jgi:hypothetical protein